MDTEPTLQALRLFTHFVDGDLTEHELVCGLAGLPPELIKQLPISEVWPRSGRNSLRTQVLELQRAIAEGRAWTIGG